MAGGRVGVVEGGGNGGGHGCEDEDEKVDLD